MSPPTAAPGEAHQQFVSRHANGIPVAVVSHESVVGEKKPIVFVRDDESGLPPLGSGGRVAPRVKEDNSEAVFREVARESGVSVTSVPAAKPAEEARGSQVVDPAPGPSVVEVSTGSPKKAAPKHIAVFVNDVMDLEVPCWEISWSPDAGFLSLIIPVSSKLKLAADQEVRIRVPSYVGAPEDEAVYWFTGVKVSVSVYEANLYLFGKKSNELQ